MTRTDGNGTILILILKLFGKHERDTEKNTIKKTRQRLVSITNKTRSIFCKKPSPNAQGKKDTLKLCCNLLKAELKRKAWSLI